MENRQNVVADYLELRIMLNRTNPKRNQKTEIEFRFMKEGKSRFVFVAILKGVEKIRFLELCSRTGHKEGWKSSGYSGLSDLEYFCENFLNANMKSTSDLQQMQVVLSSLWKELRSLGIPV